MRFVETDIQHLGDDAPVTTPPRPEHRRVYTSLVFTFSVLAATVTAVYTLFPARDNELLTVAVEQHHAPSDWELLKPSATELLAWGVGVVGTGAPFPTTLQGAELLGVRATRVFNRPMAMARYKLETGPLSYFVLRSHDAVPRSYQRKEGALHVVSWRKGKWTMVAVGPASARASWAHFLGAP